jgi:hypothetical protein
MAEPLFQSTQREFAAHMRHPDLNGAPATIEDRRLAIYRNLIFNNIESFLGSGFPILKSIIAADKWTQVVRDFIYRHECQTPYFLKISEEFIKYLELNSEDYPPFMLELAHYEWVELALDVSMQVIPNHPPHKVDVLDDVALISPLAWRLCYRYPVHKMDSGYTVDNYKGTDIPTFLIVYRNRDLKVGFIEANAVTFRLLDIIETDALPGRTAILKLAKEIEHPELESLLAFGAELLYSLANRDVIYGFREI